MNNMFLVTVSFVGTVLLLTVAGIVFLASQGMTVPDILPNVAVGCLTGLVSLLVNPKTKSLE